MGRCLIKDVDPKEVYFGSELREQGIDTNSLKWVRTKRGLTEERVALYQWCEENCVGDFVLMTHYNWGFVEDIDELMFKLAWGGERI